MHEHLSTLIGKQAEKIPAMASHADLRGATAEELAQQFRLTLTAARKVHAAIKLGTIVSTTPTLRGAAFRGSADVHHVFGPKLRDLKVEQFWIVLLDGKHKAMREILVSQGTLTSSPVHPREVFAPAIRHSAAAIVLVHNHPSGDPSPSADDLDITRRLSDAGTLVGIPVLDHIVIGDGTYVSLADRGLIPSSLR